MCDQNFAEDGQMDDGVAYFTNYEKLLGTDLDILPVCLTNDVNPAVTTKDWKGFHIL